MEVHLCRDGDKAASTGEQSQQHCPQCPLHAAFHLLCQELGAARGVLGQQQELVPARMLLPHKRGASPCWWLAGGLCSRPSSWHLSETLYSFFFHHAKTNPCRLLITGLEQHPPRFSCDKICQPLSDIV